MKEIFEIFDENCDKISNLLDQSHLVGCARISTDLITISQMSEFKEGLFIAEIFEGVFTQIDRATKGFDVDEKNKTKINTELKNQIKIIQNTLKNKNFEKTYEHLKDLRNIATNFQAYVFNTMKEKTDADFRRFM